MKEPKLTSDELQLVEYTVNDNKQKTLESRELEQYRKCLLFMWNAGMIKNKIMRNLQRVVCELDSRYQNRGGE